MKLAMNGALTIGTLDGANIELCEEVGSENMFIFGLKSAEIQELREQRAYQPRQYYERFPALQRVVDTFRSALFCPQEHGLFTWIYHALVDHGDHYFHLADFPSYHAAHQQAAQLFTEPEAWARKAILNVARCGKFSSDRTIQEYARDIWHIRSV